MPSAAIQSRIDALQAHARSDTDRNVSQKILSPKTSSIDLNDWVVDDMSASSLILDSPPMIKAKPKPNPKPPSLQSKPAVQNNDRPPSPLPPRKQTNDSLYPPLVGMDTGTGSEGSRKGNHVPASSVSSLHSVSLSSDTDPGTPNSLANMIPTYPIDRAPSPATTESFEEVSIPLPPPPPLPRRPSPPSRPSLKVQTPAQSPSSYVPPYATRRVPPLPPSRASDRSSIQSSASSSQSRRNSSNPQTPTTLPSAPPFPPSPSILSTTSTAATIAAAKTKRPTPVPSAARKRYESVFNANIVQRRRAEASNYTTKKPSLLSPAEAKRTRQAAGWRGISVDLTTLPDEHEAKGKEPVLLQVDETVKSDDRLEGAIVKAIWLRARIDKSKLAEIWHECDPNGTGSLDLDGFVRGMWRIDEHLRRAQTQTAVLRNASSTSLSALRTGFGSLRLKSSHNSDPHRTASRSSLGTSISRSSSVSSRPYPAHEYPPLPIPKIVLR